MLKEAIKYVQIGATALVAIAAAVTGYHLVRSQVAVQVYRDRLMELSQEYEHLRATYNAAVKKTAVTELDVKDGKLSIVIRTAEGVLKTVPTPYDPTNEIHVDYVVIEGRLWIRRIHDNKTASRDALVIDPQWAQIDWKGDDREYGLTIYRPLSEGRWVVSITNNGALSLKRMPAEAETALSGPPPIREYEQLDREVQTQLEDIGPGDVLRRMFRPG